MKNIKSSVETDANGRRFIKDHFIYSVVANGLAAGASISSLINIEANSDFVWLKSSYRSDSGATQTESTRQIPVVNVAITDSGSGVNLQNIPTPISSLAGHEGLPLNISVPRTFNANSTITLTFSNAESVGAAKNITFSMIGYRKFYI